jgi:hypothetical protein
MAVLQPRPSLESDWESEFNEPLIRRLSAE